jgi:hypothetical protein
MSEGLSLADGYRRIIWPSVIAALLPFALLWLPGAHWRAVPVIAAAALTRRSTRPNASRYVTQRRRACRADRGPLAGVPG